MGETGTELDLGRLLGILLRKSWLLLLSAILGAGISLAGTYYLVTPQYESSVMLYVNETRSAKDLADSFSVVVKMRESLMEILQYTQLLRGHNELRKQITVSSVNETDFVEITVSSPDPYEAELIANAIGQILPGQVSAIMEGTSVKVVGEAVVAAEPSTPSYPNNALLGGLTGFLLSAGAVIIQECILKKEKIRSD